MSKQVDERVVSMQFDNRHFEANVNTTMSTLDKLKQKLNFKDSAKSFANLDSAAKKVDMNTLGNAVETVRVKFSALEVMGVTAIANITNSAVNAGKQLVKSLSVDQITAGMSKYEQKTASVQTIMNATGKSIDEVNGYLEKLMWFSDETSYGFTDMTAALGQMTSSGGDIEKLIPLITGVANATAYAGKGAAEFSRVMYNLNQSYGAGYLQLMDWKSLELAGVGSKQLKQTLIDVGVELGKIKKGQVTIANFSETLKDKWATTEVMETAFGRFGEFSDAVHKMVASGEVETASEAIEKLSGQYGDIAEKAFKSAQEAKSFTEAIDATKDAVSSGWMKTFELIFGNYEQAKVLWTDLANTLWDLFASGGESRNSWLEEALSYSPLEKFAEKLDNVTKTIQAPVKKLEEYNDIVNRIIRGDYGNGQSRFDKLAEEGYNWAHAQNLVNEKLGNSYRYSTDLADATGKLTQQTIELTDAKLKEMGLTEEEIEIYRELEAESKKTGKSISELIENMEQADGRTLLIGSFKNVGSALIGVIKSIKEAFSDIFPAPTAMQLYNFIAGLNKLTQCLRLTDAETGELNETGQKLKRTFKGVFALFDIILTVVGGPIKIAFKVLMKILGSFNLNILDVTASIGDAIVGFRDWIDSTLDFTKVFEYLSELLSPAAKKVQEWISSFKSLPIIQDAMNKLKSAFSSDFNSNALVKGFKAVGEVLITVGKGIKKCVDAFMSLPAVQNVAKKLSDIFANLFGSISSGLKGVKLDSVVDTITKFFDAVSKWLSGFGDQEDNGKNLIDGLGNAISGGVRAVITAITEICKAIYDTFTNFFDINSPSKVFFTLGKFCIAGLVAGLLFAKEDTTSAMAEIGSELLEGVKVAVSNIVDIIKQIDLKTIFAVGGAAVMFKTINNIIGVMDKFASGVKGFGSMCSEAGSLIKNFNNKVFPKETKMEKTSNVVLKMAAAIGILAASIYVLAQLDTGKLWGAVGAIVALALILAGLTFAASKLKVDGGDFGKLSVLLLGLSATMLIMATAIKKLEFLNEYNVGPILLGLAGMIGGITLLLLAFGKLTKGTLAKNINKASMVIAQISLTMLLLTFTLKAMSKLDPSALAKGLSTMVLFGAFIAGLVAVTKLSGKNIAGLGKTILGISVAMLALIGVIKLVSLLNPEEVAGGILCITLFGGLIAGLIAATRLAGGSKVEGIGKTIFALSAAMVVLALAVKILSKMEPGAFAKGMICITLFGGLITGLIAATRLAGGNNLKGVAGTLLAATLAMGMMAAIAVILSLISIEGLIKGITAVSILGAVIALMIHSTKDAKDAKANIIAMTTAIGIMAASVLVLSLIPIDKLTAATIALSSVMGMFALMTKAMGSSVADPKKWGKSVSSILILTTVVAALGGILVLMSKWSNPTALISAGTAISILLATMAGALTVMNNTKSMTKAALSKNMTALGIMTGVVAGLALVLGALSLIPNPSNLIPTATAISILLITMTGVLTVLSLLGTFTSKAMTGILALTAMVVPLVAFGVALAMLPNIGDKATSITILTGVMVAMTGLLVVLSLIGVLIGATGGMALLGIAGLTLMIVPLAAFALALNALPDISGTIGTVNLLTTLMTAMSDVLFKISILGPLAMIGVTVITKLTGVMIAIGALAAGIGALVTKFPQLEEFIDTGIPILEKLANGIGSIIGNFVSGFATGAMSGLPEIGALLSQFITNAMPFIIGIKMVDDNTIKSVGTLVGAIIALTAADMLSNMSKFMSFGSSFADLGTELSKFMTNAMPFIAGASLLNDTMMKGVKNLAETVLILTAADLLSGLTSWLTGEKSFATFGEGLGGLGKNIKTFADELSGFDESQMETVKSGAEAIKILAEAAKEIPNEGGWAGAICGENSLGSFSEGFGKTGEALSAFISSIGSFGKDQLSTVSNAADAIVKIAEAAKEIPNEGGLWAGLCGDNSLSDFSDKLPGLGSNLSEFVKNAGDVNANKVKTVVSVLNVLIDLANLGIVKTGTDLAMFGSNLVSFGKSLKTFCNRVKDVSEDTVAKAVSNVKAISEAFSVLTNKDAEPLVTFGNALKTLATDGVSSVNNAFTNGKDTIKTAIVSFIAAASGAITTQENYDKFSSAGKYLVKGFAKGITDNISIGENAASKLEKAVYKKAKEELDINSPSKKFMPIGSSVVEGFAKGVTENLGYATDSAKTLGSAMLKATQKELKINSPSIVFSKEVGRYIVQGIADGIKKDMSAEEAAEQKARNIVDAFKKALDRYDTESNKASKELELWNYGDGKYATDAEIDAKQLDYYNNDLSRKLSKQTLAYDEWKETAKYFGEGSDEAKEAWNKYLDAQIEVAKVQESISEINDRITQYDNDERAKAMDMREKLRENWLKGNGKYATDAEIDARYIADYKADIKNLEADYAEALKEYEDVINKYPAGHAKIDAAWNKVVDLENRINDKKADIEAIEDNALERESNNINDRIAARNKEHELWEKTDGKYLEDQEKAAKKIKTLRDNLTDQQSDILVAEQQYREAVEEYGNESEEAKNAWNKVLDAKLAVANTQQEIADVTEEAAEKERESLETQYDLASSNADLLYQIWEKTSGRKATSVEKNAAKLTMLTKQLQSQSSILQLSYDEWQKAASKYGEYSNEANSAYNNYLQEQLELANLQNEITEINESTVERQRLAQSDYKDYIEKYEKYYSMNGMTREELEEDAKLISGYDPDNTVKTMVDRTNEALGNITSSPQYANVLTNFNSIGSSYVDAVNDGVQNSKLNLSNSVVTMIDHCTTVIKSQRTSWVEAGNYLVDGLIHGILAREAQAIEAAIRVALAALRAAQSTLGIASPSKEFAKVGMFAMMGFVKGLTDNTKLVTNAVSTAGENSINTLSNSIKRISEVVNSEMDTQPTIRPVLDLSNVESGTARLNSLFSRQQALSISRSMSRSNNDVNQNGGNIPTSGGNTYQFTQNNYSPKALSSIEIYRQTKNQFTAWKGAQT